MYLGWNPVYWMFALPALLVAFAAQAVVRSTYQKYLRVPNAARVTGTDAAGRLMREAGIYLSIEGAAGQLSDHCDPRHDVLRLLQDVATRASVASVAIVAHEVGHAQQDAQSFLPMRLRSRLVPVVSLASWLGPILFFAGLWLDLANLQWVGVLTFAGAVVFALITLPVELNASQRGLRLLEQSGVLAEEKELRGARAVAIEARQDPFSSLPGKCPRDVRSLSRDG